MIFGTNYLTREYQFHGVTQVSDADSELEKLIGNTFRLRITVTGLVEDDGTVDSEKVIDSRTLDDLIRENIIDFVDGSVIITGKEPIAEYLMDEDYKFYQVDGSEATLENIARHIFLAMEEILPKKVYVKNVRLYAQDDVWVDYKARDYEMKMKGE